MAGLALGAGDLEGFGDRFERGLALLEPGLPV
jgi:hypothetical protein